MPKDLIAVNYYKNVFILAYIFSDDALCYIFLFNVLDHSSFIMIRIYNL